jgi:WbqC-like protein family
MPKTVVITQPTYLPWLGYFEQVATADVFIFLDNVQFVTRSWHSRNRLKGTNSQPLWLTVPVMTHSQKTSLLDIKISPNQPQWRKKHLTNIQTFLGSAPYFHTFYPYVKQWLETEYEYLVDLNIAGIKMLSNLLDLSPQFIRASALNPEGKSTRLLLNICQKVGAEHYYTSIGSKEYLEEEKYLLTEAGIELSYQTWEHPTYPQQGEGFVSHLSVLDALMNLGQKTTRSLIFK